MATMNISLPDTMREAINARIEGGHFANASDYVRDLMRRDLELEKLERLHAAIDEGMDSGEPVPFDPEALLSRIKAKRLA